MPATVDHWESSALVHPRSVISEGSAWIGLSRALEEEIDPHQVDCSFGVVEIIKGSS